MSETKKTGLRGPAIAVVIIVVCFVVYDVWFLPKPASPSPPAPPLQSAPEAKPKTEPVTAQSSAESSAEAPDATMWSTYHGGPDLSGYSKVALPDAPAVLWQYIAEGDIRQPAVGDERGIYVATSNGWIVALDFAGKVRWKRQLTRTAKDGAETPERFEAPVACFRSTVVIGSRAGIVHAIDAGTGGPRWTYDVEGEVLGTVNFHAPEDTSSPALLYVIERGEGVLRCIDFETGTEVWRTDPIARTDGSVAVAGGTVAYGSCDFAFHVYGAAEGRRISTIDLCGDCQVASGPALVGNELYSGSRSGHIFRVDITSGSVVWTNEDTTKEVFTTPALSKDRVVLGAEDGGVYCLERASGKQTWRYESNGLPTSAVIASDRVLLGVDGELIFLTLDSGKEVWRYEVSDGIASPSIINEMVVVGSEDGTVIAFGSKPNS